MSLLYIQLGIYFVCVIGLLIYYQLNCQSVVDLNFYFVLCFSCFIPYWRMMVQVAQEIHSEASFQKDFLDQLVCY